MDDVTMQSLIDLKSKFFPNTFASLKEEKTFKLYQKSELLHKCFLPGLVISPGASYNNNRSRNMRVDTREVLLWTNVAKAKMGKK